MWLRKLFQRFRLYRDLEIRTHDNPDTSGIDLTWAQRWLQNIFVNTGIYAVVASEPTYKTSGILTPNCNNGAYTMLRNVVVSVTFNGIVCNEHTDGDGIVVAANVNGLNFYLANHASRFGRVGAYRNTYHVVVAGRHGFSIQQLAIENAGPGQTNPQNMWQKTIADVKDPANQSFADISYWVVEGAVGPVATFTKIGGDGVQAHRIGSRRATCTSLKSDDAESANTFFAPDYGAADDDSTNNTDAFSRCLHALVTAGGGKMVLPRTQLGIYQGNIVIPPVKVWTTVEIVGGVQPAPIVGTVGSSKQCSNCPHTVIKGLSADSAVIRAAPLNRHFSMVFVSIQDLEVRTFDNPTINGVDLSFAQQCNVANVFINTGVYSVQASKPVHNTSGLITPLINNGAYTMLKNVVVSGYFNGIVCNESTH